MSENAALSKLSNYVQMVVKCLGFKRPQNYPSGPSTQGMGRWSTASLEENKFYFSPKGICWKIQIASEQSATKLEMTVFLL